MKTAEAFETLKAAIRADEGYAYSWHCNIAMSAYDEIAKADGSNHDWAHERANQAATRFMKTCFDVDTKYIGE